MTTLYPYLSFNNTKEALEYYKTVFGATDIKRLPVSKEQASHFGLDEIQAENATMHSEFVIGGAKLHASDSFGKPDLLNGAISLMLDYDIHNQKDADEIETLYERIKTHDTITIELPFETQFWGGKMGVFTDKYGVRWMLHGNDVEKMK
ncbi:VOC family protein [Staphylococcus sp. 17KM0847]|uniref:VOC family protein n=1 Tax=Staphylococcus sp. 17KM0847 TaxID=2583989 RepID=UPI0015DC8FBF|nr:glyoxalase/bleomycin resistance/extradiol dioxygenase family protein [Staphylococcus sp. 17KM0847]QLK85787.1 glyoxalase/bleomycin resistance/extradiol dioxygenase family protein [Staphylococcus sp. 17KM0847]